MTPDEFEYVMTLLGNVVITGATLILVDWITDAIIDYSGTRVPPGMETSSRLSDELGCKCPSCDDSFGKKPKIDIGMDPKDWEDMVLKKSDSKYDPETGELRKKIKF